MDENVHNGHQILTDDEFSAHHRFIVEGLLDDRNYFNAGVILKRHIVHVLQSMNSSPEYQGKNGDRAFINSLLDRVFTRTELAESSVLGNYSHGIAHAPLCPRRLGFVYGNIFHQIFSVLLLSLKWSILKLFFLIKFQICSGFEFPGRTMPMKDWQRLITSQIKSARTLGQDKFTWVWSRWSHIIFKNWTFIFVLFCIFLLTFIFC